MAGQHLFKNHPIGIVIVNDQYGHAVQCIGQNISIRHTIGPTRKTGFKKENTALVRLAFHIEFSTHQLDQLGGNGQTKPRAAILPRRRTICLIQTR